MRIDFPTRQVTSKLPVSSAERFTAGDASAGLRGDDSAPTTAVGPLYRFLAGRDADRAAMSADEVRALGDVFSREILLKGAVPLTLRDLVQAIADVQDPPLPMRRMFLVAEGAQFAASGRPFELNARLVFTWQSSDSKPPDILVSTVAVADNPGSLLQLIAWSDTDHAFHFFERKEGVWTWVGNSFHALEAPTRGQGPFDSHVNGGLVMKELKAPWTHWHSMNASIARDVFGPESEFSTDPLFADLEGAQILEKIVKTGVRRWTKGRLVRDLNGGRIVNLREYMRQVLWCTSINLVSSSDGFGSNDPEFDLPTSFFFDVDALDFLANAMEPPIDIIPNKRLRVDAALYRDAVKALEIGVVEDGAAGRRITGDTHFAFLVPERAFEDLTILVELVSRSVLSGRLALSLLLVDFTNPIFSPSRAALLQYCQDTIATGADGAALDAAFVNAVRAAGGDPASPEGKFLELWDHPDLSNHARSVLQNYHEAVEQRLATADGVADLLTLAESRREAVRRTRSLAEFSSTLARGAAPTPHLEMAADGTIRTKTSQAGEGEL